MMGRRVWDLEHEYRVGERVWTRDYGVDGVNGTMKTVERRGYGTITKIVPLDPNFFGDLSGECSYYVKLDDPDAAICDWNGITAFLRFNIRKLNALERLAEL
jgi:hypothetical protein